MDLTNEIIEALEEYYKGNHDVFVDCMVFLINRKIDRPKIADYLVEKGFCPKCGCELCTANYSEVHCEISGNNIERHIEVYCPECDFRE